MSKFLPYINAVIEATNMGIMTPREGAVITGIDFAEGVITIERPKLCQFEEMERGNDDEG